MALPHWTDVFEDDDQPGTFWVYCRCGWHAGPLSRHGEAVYAGRGHRESSEAPPPFSQRTGRG